MLSLIDEFEPIRGVDEIRRVAQSLYERWPDNCDRLPRMLVGDSFIVAAL